MNTLKEILESDKEFDERYYDKNTPSGLNQDYKFMKCLVNDIKSYIHSRDKKLLMAVVGEIKKLEQDENANEGGTDFNEGLEAVTSLLQDLIK